MNLYIVPNELSEILYKIVDEAIKKEPKLKEGREEIYKHCLGYYNDTGIIPSINIKPNPKEE